jgi:hypothetical protein
VRAIENLPPMEGGDQLFIQGATVPLAGQAAGQPAAQADAGGVPASQMDMNSYGIAVRSGFITPQMEDEEKFRLDMGLPQMSARAKELWEKQQGTRTPVTIKSGSEGQADAAAAGQPDAGA